MLICRGTGLFRDTLTDRFRYRQRERPAETPLHGRDLALERRVEGGTSRIQQPGNAIAPRTAPTHTEATD